MSKEQLEELEQLQAEALQLLDEHVPTIKYLLDSFDNHAMIALTGHESKILKVVLNVMLGQLMHNRIKEKELASATTITATVAETNHAPSDN